MWSYVVITFWLVVGAVNSTPFVCIAQVPFIPTWASPVFRHRLLATLLTFKIVIHVRHGGLKAIMGIDFPTLAAF